MKNVAKDNSPQIEPAGAWARLWASVTDGLILGIPSLLLYFFLLTPLSSLILSSKTAEANNLVKIYGIFALLVSLFYYVYLTVKKGATWGKNLYGLRVVKYKTTQHINYKPAIIREVTKISLVFIPIICFLIFLLNIFIVIFSKEKRAIHDRIAGTQVIKVTKPWSIRKQLVLLFLIIILPIIVFYVGSFLISNIPLKPLAKTKDCGSNLDCFIIAAQSCSPAIVRNSGSIRSSYNDEGLKKTFYVEIKGPKGLGLNNCTVYEKVENIEVKLSDNQIKQLLSSGKSQQEISQLDGLIHEPSRAIIGSAWTCKVDIDYFVRILEYTKRANQSESASWGYGNCVLENSGHNPSQSIQSQKNNNAREEDIYKILSAIKWYMENNKGIMPHFITISEREISKSESDLCSFIVPNLLMSLPSDPKKSNSKTTTDCKTSYSTGYTVVRDPRTNLITVKAPLAELSEIIQITR